MHPLELIGCVSCIPLCRVVTGKLKGQGQRKAGMGTAAAAHTLGYTLHTLVPSVSTILKAAILKAPCKQTMLGRLWRDLQNLHFA